VREKHVRAFVMLSGGIDSATALYRAMSEFVNVSAVSFDYGQRHGQEIAHAAKLARANNLPHVVLQLGTSLSGHNVMLTDPTVKIPDISYNQIEGISPTYVPFRNGTMLAVLAAHAMKYVQHVQIEEGLDPNSSLLKDLVTLYFGAHAEDAKNWAYPDCTPEFIGSMGNAIYIGSYQTVRLCAPFVHLTKASIIKEGTLLGVPYENTWSCYAGGIKHCGTCPTCRARKDAFSIAGIVDPTAYAA
jgi:7-cyano-7-deazaguanine synthase